MLPIEIFIPKQRHGERGSEWLISGCSAAVVAKACHKYKVTHQPQFGPFYYDSYCGLKAKLFSIVRTPFGKPIIVRWRLCVFSYGPTQSVMSFSWTSHHSTDIISPIIIIMIINLTRLFGKYCTLYTIDSHRERLCRKYFGQTKRDSSTCVYNLKLLLCRYKTFVLEKASNKSSWRTRVGRSINLHNIHTQDINC